MSKWSITHEQSRVWSAARLVAMRDRRPYTAFVPIPREDGTVLVLGDAGTTYAPQEDGRWHRTLISFGRVVGHYQRPELEPVDGNV